MSKRRRANKVQKVARPGFTRGDFVIKRLIAKFPSFGARKAMVTFFSSPHPYVRDDRWIKGHFETTIRAPIWSFRVSKKTPFLAIIVITGKFKQLTREEPSRSNYRPAENCKPGHYRTIYAVTGSARSSAFKEPKRN